MCKKNMSFSFPYFAFYTDSWMTRLKLSRNRRPEFENILEIWDCLAVGTQGLISVGKKSLGNVGT